jgi:hypothetical protein
MSGKDNDGVNVQVLLRCRCATAAGVAAPRPRRGKRAWPLSRGPTAARRPLSTQEIADRTPAVVSCNEALREVTLYQFAAGKQLSRTFHFDKVRRGARGRARRGGLAARATAIAT